ncbi:MAG: tetratricopeptide repeat protein [Planctomycetia bacterium]|nr:tetratricopeptide repeat protein [Planctomycetia bacterium]
MRRAVWGIVLIACAISGSFASDNVERAVLLRDATIAAREGKLADATRLATQAIEAAPSEMDGYRLRAGLYAAAGEHKLAIADYDQLLKLDPRLAEMYDQRGSQRFMLGQIKQSIEDFDRFLELKPQQEPYHWKRGISYYYAGRYDDGRRQFEGYQTVDDNDVENAVWRYLCMARSLGVPAARDAMLKIKQDPRVPMMEVYALYSGKARPHDVLAAARADSPTPEVLNAQLFYAHLYLGLYYEAAGDTRLAREHIGAAVEHKIGHYMWNVAQVHAKLLKTAASPS